MHHVDSFVVMQNLATYNHLWPNTDADHFVYRLGLPMRTQHELQSGKIIRNTRVWCAIDTSLSGAFSTISDAHAETKRRLA